MSKIITKESGVIYNELTQNIINFHNDNNLTVAVVDRDLTYDDGNYVDDITQSEVNLGYDNIREFLYQKNTDPLFFKVQRGEIEEQAWLDAIQVIKNEWVAPVLAKA